MQKLFLKHETLSCILLIVAYVIINSYCIQNFGLADYRSTLINTVISLLLIGLIIKLGRVHYYGFVKVHAPKKYLYFIPLVLIASVNLWGGLEINLTVRETIFFVGFIEEVIFRGFLFKMMAKDNLKMAIVVSAVTFGIGHIINLLNGGDLIPTLLQIFYAIALGYLFVIIFYKSKSLLPCIITHIIINVLSIFNTNASNTSYLIPLFIIIVSVSYAFYINKKVRVV